MTIKSRTTVVRTLRHGGHVRRGQWSRPWLLVEANGRRRSVAWATVRELIYADPPVVERIDDYSSRCGEKWGWIGRRG